MHERIPELPGCTIRRALNGVEAIERITRACYRSFSRLPNARLIDDGRLFGVLTDVPIGFFSGIAMSDVTEAEVPEVLERIGARPFRWWISPSTRPVNLAEVLAAQGLHHTYDATGMAIDLRVPLDTALPPGLSIERVTELDEWARVLMDGFNRPESERPVWQSAYEQFGGEWIHFVGRLEGEAVATTSLLECGNGLAGIYHVVTLPPARGRGVGRAITIAALQYAKERGAVQAALQASAMGLSVYRAIGFVPYCDLVLYDRRV